MGQVFQCRHITLHLQYITFFLQVSLSTKTLVLNSQNSLHWLYLHCQHWYLPGQMLARSTSVSVCMSVCLRLAGMEDPHHQIWAALVLAKRRGNELALLLFITQQTITRPCSGYQQSGTGVDSSPLWRTVNQCRCAVHKQSNLTVQIQDFVAGLLLLISWCMVILSTQPH